MNLKINNHQILRGNTLLVQDLNLELRLGQRLVVSGQNGCGKSSFLEDLHGSSQFQIPTINWSTENIKMFRMTQNLAFDLNSPDSVKDYLLKTLDVFANQNSGNNHRGSVETTIDKTLEKVQLKSKWLCELSGGEKQKLKFAQCLILKPQVLLLDEPFSAVDPTTKFQLYHTLDSLLPQTLQIIVVHDLLDIRRLNSPVLVFERPQATLYDPLTWFRKIDSLLHADPCHSEIHLWT
ncbi:MAG: ATP-binding cassette domain-containing protein [Bdellovibrionales bacterium]